jgi:hypothetical protein
MRYLFLLYGVQGSERPESGTPEYRKTLEAYRDATEAMARAGVLVDCAPLQPVDASTTVRVRDGETRC